MKSIDPVQDYFEATLRTWLENAKQGRQRESAFELEDEPELEAQVKREVKRAS